MVTSRSACSALRSSSSAAMAFLVHLPHRFGGREDQPVHHAAARRQHAGDAVGIVAMFVPAGAQSVAADEAVARLDAGGLRDLRAEHGFHRLGPGLALRQRHTVVRRVVGRGADDAKAAEASPRLSGISLATCGCLASSCTSSSRILPGGTSMWNTPGQDQLHGAALGADHQVDAGQVALEGAIDLLAGQQHESDGRQAQREQQQVEQRGKRSRPEVAEGERDGASWRRPSCAGARAGRPWRRARPPARAGRALRSPGSRCSGMRRTPAA